MHFLNSGSDFLVSYLARVLSMSMRAKKSKKAVEASEAYRDGKARNAYQLRRNIKAGMCAISGTDEAICLQCKSLLDLCSIFDSFVYSGMYLKRRKAKPAGIS